MRLLRSSKRVAISILAISLLSPTILAEDATVLPNLSNAAASESAAAAAAVAASTTTRATPPNPQTTESSSTKPGDIATITPTNAAQSQATITNSVPSLLTSTTAVPLPTLTAINSGADTVNTYPAPSVPPTSNAPFMQTSSLPTNTVFIFVGAILAFFTVGILAWRAFLAWSLNRSVMRAAGVSVAGDMKKELRTSKTAAPMKEESRRRRTSDVYGGGGYRDRGSVISLGPIKKNGASGVAAGGVGGIANAKGMVNSPSRPDTAATTDEAARHSLYFSPTANATPGMPNTLSNLQGHRHSGSAASGTRNSAAYFPPGYYAAGSSANISLGGGGVAGPGNISPGISLSNLSSSIYGNGPSSQYQYQRANTAGVSPPDSPVYTVKSPQGGDGAGYGAAAYSSSSLDLSGQGRGGGGGSGSGRAPSAYLDDLFDAGGERRGGGGGGGGRRGY